MRMSVLGSAKRLPAAPPVSRNWPIDAAMPMRDGHHVVRDVLHGVVDRHAGRHRAAGAVDVEVDVLVRVRGKEQHLRRDLVGDVVVDLLAEEDDALAEQPVVDLVAEATTDGRLTGGVRHQIRHVSTCSSLTAAGRLSVFCRGVGPSGRFGDSPALVFMDPNARVPAGHPGSASVRSERKAGRIAGVLAGVWLRAVRASRPPGSAYGTDPRPWAGTGYAERAPGACGVRGPSWGSGARLRPRSSPRSLAASAVGGVPRPLRRRSRRSRPRRPGRRPRRWCR